MENPILNFHFDFLTPSLIFLSFFVFFVILGHLSYERSSSMLYVGMGWKGLGMMVIIGHRTFESTFGAIYINDNTCCASSNSRRFSLFFSIAPSVKKKLIRAD